MPILNSVNFPSLKDKASTEEWQARVTLALLSFGGTLWLG